MGQPPTEIKRRKTSKNKELKRLENFNPDVLERRRTRSDAVAESTKTQREIRSNLRSAFNYGIAPVRNFMRSVSSSLPKIFKDKEASVKKKRFLTKIFL